ncbi:alpha/beta hydrolase fold protein [Hyaloraphidium curvatum]|nr:alpha/beta hydrolase fold protein [Hyaloraphidium curvatum]
MQRKASSPPSPVPDEISALLAASTVSETHNDGVTVVWRTWGTPVAGTAPLVFFHGGSGSWTHWIRNIPRFARERLVIVPDLPGFGDSDALPVPGGGGVFEAAPHVVAGLRRILDGRPADIVGFSFGGMMGSLVLDLDESLVRRLVLVGAPAFGVRGPRPKLVPWTQLPPAERPAAHRRNLEILMVADPAAADDLAVWLHQWNQERDRMRKRGPALGTDAALQALKKRPQTRLDAIYGEKDFLYLGKLDELWQVLDGLPNVMSKTIIKGAGHWAMYEKAEEFNGLLERVLAEPAEINGGAAVPLISSKL